MHHPRRWHLPPAKLNQKNEGLKKMNYTELFKMIAGKTGTIYYARKGTVTVFCVDDQTYLVNNSAANGRVVVNPSALYWANSIDWAGGFSDYFTFGLYPAKDMPYKADPILPITPELRAKLAVRANLA